MERLLNYEGYKIKIVQYSTGYEDLVRKNPSANSNMDNYVIGNALRDKSEGKALTFLFINEQENYLYGYYSLFATSVIYPDEETDEFAGIPSIELKLFAINENLNGKTFPIKIEGNYLNYSDLLLSIIIGDIYNYSDNNIGINAIVLRSTNRALNFYKKNRFIEFQDFLNLPYDCFSHDCIPLILVL